MRKLLLASTALLALMASPAGASAILHVNDIQGSGGVNEPVPITSQTQFFVEQTGNGQNTPAPLFIYFLDFPGGVAPTITSAFLNGNPPNVAGGVTLDGTYTLGNGQSSFYSSYLNCQGCSNSINDTNISDAYSKYFQVAAPTTFDVYKAVVNGGFNGNEFYEINGLFGKGTVIIPFADTDVGTSWTNAGLITGTPDICLGCVPTPTSAVPEPATWAMMILGFFGVGGMAMIKRRREGQAFRLV
jgi:hypothetical protein